MGVAVHREDSGSGNSTTSTTNDEGASSTISSNPYHNANVVNPFSLTGIHYTTKDPTNNIFGLSPVKLLKAVVKNFWWAQVVLFLLVLYAGMFIIVAIVDAGYSSSTPETDCATSPPAAAYCCRVYLDTTPRHRAFLIEQPLLFDGMQWILSFSFAIFWWFAGYQRIKKKWNILSASRFYVVYLLVAAFVTAKAFLSMFLLISAFRRSGGSFLAMRSIGYVLDAVFVGILVLHFARFWREKPRANLESGVILI